VPARKTHPGPFRSLDSQSCSRHDAGVQAPATKTLGDILYADKSKIRVSENEWLRLIQAIAGGDQGALHSLYEQTNRIVFTLIVRIIMNRETAEQVTLDVFYDVWRKASTYDPANGSVVGWIMNRVRSRAIEACKQRLACGICALAGRPIPVRRMESPARRNLVSEARHEASLDVVIASKEVACVVQF
jgi:DNA-directed RNA polymerase specialized sigma24 family protein